MRILTTLNILTLIIFISGNTYGQIEETARTDVYNYNWKWEVPFTALGAGLTYYGFYRINQKSPTDPATVMALDKNDVWSINRGAINPYDNDIGARSDIFFIGSFPYPFLLLLDKHIRQDALTYIGLYLETLAITGMSYSWTVASVNKHRPYVYHEDSPMHRRTGPGGKNAFYGGHPSLTFAATLFAAKVYSDYHPENNFKYVLYGICAATTFANAYYRYQGGYHFPTDIAIGLALGGLYGWGVPHLHKKRPLGSSTSLVPFSGYYHGLSLHHKF